MVGYTFGIKGNLRELDEFVGKMSLKKSQIGDEFLTGVAPTAQLLFLCHTNLERTVSKLLFFCVVAHRANYLCSGFADTDLL